MLSTLQQEGVLAPPMPWSAEETFSLAAEGQVNDEKLHQGVTGKKAGLHQGAMACNSTTALGVSWGQSSRTASGATVSYDYDAFGNSFTVTGSTPNNYLYRGEQFDSELALYYLRARYYNPVTGRFMSRDPHDGKPNDPRTLHKYLYAGGDPINAMDPTGRDLFDTALITGGSAVTATEAGLAITGGAISEAAAAAYEALIQEMMIQMEINASVAEVSATYQEALWAALRAKGVIKILVCDGASVAFAMLDAYAFKNEKLDPVAAAAIAGAITVFRDVCKIWP